MSVYIALLRGINVGGQKIVLMEELRKSCARLGFEGVETHVQSGNVVFRAAPRSAANLASGISNAIQRDFGFPVTVVVRTADELRAVAKGNPFLKERGIDPLRLYVTFLSEAPSKEGLARLKALPAGSDRLSLKGREIYLHAPNGYGRSKLANTAVENALSITATTRNWNTVDALLELTSKRPA